MGKHKESNLDAEYALFGYFCPDLTGSLGLGNYKSLIVKSVVYIYSFTNQTLGWVCMVLTYSSALGRIYRNCTKEGWSEPFPPPLFACIGVNESFNLFDEVRVNWVILCMCVCMCVIFSKDGQMWMNLRFRPSCGNTGNIPKWSTLNYNLSRKK